MIPALCYEKFQHYSKNNSRTMLRNFLHLHLSKNGSCTIMTNQFAFKELVGLYKKINCRVKEHESLGSTIIMLWSWNRKGFKDAKT